MFGAIVPAILLPRFTSYVGEGTYTTEPLAVETFDDGRLQFWRGPLVGGAVSNPFRAYIEESHDATDWTPADTSLSQPITTANTSSPCGVLFRKRWLRVRVELAADAEGVVGITLWLVGELKLRER